MRSATAENGSGFQAYAAPATIAAAARLLADGEAVLLAGGTDLMLGHDPGQARHLVNIGRIEALRGIEIGRNRIRIGASPRCRRSWSTTTSGGRHRFSR